MIVVSPRLVWNGWHISVRVLTDTQTHSGPVQKWETLKLTFALPSPLRQSMLQLRLITAMTSACRDGRCTLSCDRHFSRRLPTTFACCDWCCTSPCTIFALITSKVCLFSSSSFVASSSFLFLPPFSIVPSSSSSFSFSSKHRYLSVFRMLGHLYIFVCIGPTNL